MTDETRHLGAIVLAGGLGTRMRPLSAVLPKPMLPVLDRPLIAHLLDLLSVHGVHDVVVDLHRDAELVMRYFGDRVRYRISPTLSGTGNAVREAARALGASSFVLLAGDVFTRLDVSSLLLRHRGVGADVTMAVRRVPDPERFGVVVADRVGRVTAFEEKPPRDQAPSDLVSAGVFVVTAEAADSIDVTRATDWSRDVLPRLVADGARVWAHEFTDYWRDVGTLVDLRLANLDAVANAADGLGDVMIDELARVADDTVLTPPAWIGPHAVVERGATLRGPIVLGSHAVVETRAWLERAVLLPGTSLEREATLSDGLLCDRRKLAEYWAR